MLKVFSKKAIILHLLRVLLILCVLLSLFLFKRRDLYLLNLPTLSKCNNIEFLCFFNVLLVFDLR